MASGVAKAREPWQVHSTKAHSMSGSHTWCLVGLIVDFRAPQIKDSCRLTINVMFFRTQLQVQSRKQGWSPVHPSYL